MFELGTHKSKLYRSSKNEWFGGTEGFYWGCNNTKDLEVRLETIASVEGRPANVVLQPSDRDLNWLQLYRRAQGQDRRRLRQAGLHDAAAGRLFIPLDAKFTTTDHGQGAEDLGPVRPAAGPDLGADAGGARRSSRRSGRWSAIPGRCSARHARGESRRLSPRSICTTSCNAPPKDDDPEIHTVAAWHGTILPKTDADVWLAAGFADYERIVALEEALKKKSDGKLTKADRDRLAVAINAYRANGEAAQRRLLGDNSAAARNEPARSDERYWIAVGKGVSVLHALREAIGMEKFCDLMDSFGRANAGKAVATRAFAEHVTKQCGKDLAKFLNDATVKTGAALMQFSHSKMSGTRP